MNDNMIPIAGTEYVYDNRLEDDLRKLRQRVGVMRTIVGTLTGESLKRLEEFFRLKNIYNSNAIEGNSLNMGETKMVIEQGLTITGKPLRDSLEAKNLNNALDLFETIVKEKDHPITLQDIRNIHTQILRGIDDRNAGVYRSVLVQISGSKYTPPNPAKLDDMMRAFGEWLVSVTEQNTIYSQLDPLVLACVAHAWFVYIHPFIDGNGRTARLIMNLLLIRNTYPLIILTKDDRQRYYDALEESQGGGDLTPFLTLVLESALESIEVYEQASQAQIGLEQVVKSLVSEQENKLKNEYEVFASAMRLLKGYFSQTTGIYNDEAEKSNISTRVVFKDFGILEFEKYQSLRMSQSAKQTWFFRLTFYKINGNTQRYLFFFGFPSNQMSSVVGENQVTIHIATELYPFSYERLSQLSNKQIPNILEVSYLPKEEKFVYVDIDGEVHRIKAEELSTEFVKQAFLHLNK